MRETRVARLKLAGVGALAFVAVFCAWPIRNIISTGAPHLTDGMVDRQGHSVRHWRGFWDWLRSWSPDDRAFGQPQACFYDVQCSPTVALFDRLGAFDSAEERRQVHDLLFERWTEGPSASVSDGFEKLAAARRARHPLSALVLPLRRSVAMWIGLEDALLADPSWRPWPRVSAVILSGYRVIHASFLLLAAIGLASLLLDASSRAAGSILAVTLGVRTLVLGWIGFCLPRYLQPVYGLLACLSAVGAVAFIRLAMRLARTFRDRRKAARRVLPS